MFIYLGSCGQQGGTKRTKLETLEPLSPDAGFGSKTKIGNKSGPISDEEKTEGEETEDTVITTSTATQLRGKWKSSCDASDRISNIDYFDISDSKFTHTIEYFAGVNCSQILMTEVNEFDFKLDESTISEDKEIRFTLTQASAVFSIERQEHIRQVNEERWFGYDDWVVKVSKDISGRAISPEIEQHLKNGARAFARFKFTENTITIEEDGQKMTLKKN